ncbi:hotdog fold thioesterase [Rhizosphaericola mali]|uniref:Hotdog fold thioesterase n=1 Tax=Rhizosphaericola mali TaxID=2545455 RepID=A0A5P2G0I9_9BACT|nr:hotdog fold thioesterase [Rhizosphaericola mali]QES89324.1 hotdog fold thioesterase [Rhizosphaericola mali]
MSRIWFKKHINLAELNASSKNTMTEFLEIQFTEIGDDYLKATMPVTAKTHQPMGILHGGASAALAETVGSIAGWLVVDISHKICVGMELNCNHIRSKKSGIVTATARPWHIGKTTQVWDIQIHDEKEKLVCISRLTLAVINQPK